MILKKQDIEQAILIISTFLLLAGYFHLLSTIQKSVDSLATPVCRINAFAG